MNHRASRQQGMTLISFLLLFSMIAGYLLLGLKMAPIYLEHFKVTTILENLQKEPSLADSPPREIMATLQKRWDINGITRISADKSLTIEMNEGKMSIHVDYEVEEPIAWNTSVVVKFDESYPIGHSR